MFLYSRRWDFLHFIRRFPRLFLAEMKYLVLCNDPDPPQDNHLLLTRPSSPISGIQEVSVAFLIERFVAAYRVIYS